jgi:Na+-translocating ferredoxin:NAD+ oxidoreductase RnfC subunit
VLNDNVLFRREFEAYMIEFKKMPGITSSSKREVMQWFRDYMEDYNTATLPHEKYYNLEKWEMDEYRRDQQRKQAERMADVDEFSFNDEAARLAERKRARDAAEKKEFDEIKARMAADTSRRADIRHQDQLRIQMQLAHKQGDLETVARLEKRLAPEEPKTTVKHPWA